MKQGTPSLPSPLQPVRGVKKLSKTIVNSLEKHRRREEKADEARLVHDGSYSSFSPVNVVYEEALEGRDRRVSRTECVCYDISTEALRILRGEVHVAPHYYCPFVLS